MDQKVIEYLRSKKILSPNATQWFATFPDGSVVLLNDLIKEFASQHYEDSDALGCAIDRVENMQYALDIPMPPSFHVEQLKALFPEVVKELKSAFVEVTGENPWN